jgi:hypothetical protein
MPTTVGTLPTTGTPATIIKPEIAYPSNSRDVTTAGTPAKDEKM